MGLVGIGALSIYSSSIARNDFSNFEKQLLFLGIGFFGILLVSFFDYRLLRNDPYLILFFYFIGLLALAGLYLFAPEIRGIKGWYRIGDISIDPIEYIKFVLIIIMAKYFALRHIEVYRIRHIVLTGIYFFIPILLIAFQPNLGPIFILAILWIVLLLVTGIRFRHLFTLIFVGILVCTLVWSVFLLDYQKSRIVSFFEPELDPLGIGWSQLQSRIAIGSGGMFGQGFGQGTQTQYGFLSEPQTDFIFAAIAEEFGLFGVSLIFLLLLLLVWRVVKIGIAAQDNFSRLYATGLATLLIAQTFINVGMNLGLLPIVGLSLPFVSYGGSSLIATYIGLGVLLSIKTH
ncbi:MAG: FtsW/RodA/SpoVE family cell cycle protein [Patescibacteria group bacterium]